ncbi:VIT family protein [Skermania sp. ID1734]|uniref:VIT1/CCC1 transporter family protein n=1 Tax=Skermania sp. ID1734 TaxID=2597516 RepID=UPI0011810E18|nr:VIT family protein [Skermania sp. ID1734]TSE00102.1 VIT family protein [Skermania sp. ID1734]
MYNDFAVPSSEPAASAEGLDALAHVGEPPSHEELTAGRLNWLRAGVLGANDGIVSTASIVMGVAGATASVGTILTAGVAGLFAGAMSMASGEYVSVSSQRDAQRALLAQERRELADDPQAELDELTGLYRAKGLPEPLAREVAQTLTARDALAAHAEVELGIDPSELTNPWQAAAASFLAFGVGAVFPLLAAVLTPATARVGIIVGVVVAALVLTGSVSARLSDAPALRPVLRNIGGGLLAMAVTYGIGALVGHTLT